MLINVQKMERFLVAACIATFSVIGSINKAPTIFGGLGKDGSFYPAVCFFLLLEMSVLFRRETIIVPNIKSTLILFYFIFVAFLSLLFNIDDWLFIDYQGTSGYGQVVVQYGSLCFYCMLAIAFYNFFRKQNDSLLFVMKWIIISATFAAIYSIFEVGALLSDSTCLTIREFIDGVFRVDFGWERPSTYARGVRSLTGEAAFFSLYSAVVLPWIFVGMFIYRGKKKVGIYMLMLLYMVFNILTTSRSAYVIFVVEIIACLFLMNKYISLRKIAGFCSMIMLIGCIGVFCFSSSEFLSNIDIVASFQSIFEYDGKHALSNMARYGSQQAAFGMFMANPLFGIGYGEFGLYAADFYPDEAWYSTEVTLWGSDIIAGPWPVTHSLYARLLAETGLWGVVSWCGFLLVLVRGLNRVRNVLMDEIEKKILGALMVSIVGIMVFGLLCDSVRMISLWLLVGLSWSCLSQNKECDARESI